MAEQVVPGMQGPRQVGRRFLEALGAQPTLQRRTLHPARLATNLKTLAIPVEPPRDRSPSMNSVDGYTRRKSAHNPFGASQLVAEEGFWTTLSRKNETTPRQVNRHASPKRNIITEPGSSFRASEKKHYEERSSSPSIEFASRGRLRGRRSFQEVDRSPGVDIFGPLSEEYKGPKVPPPMVLKPQHYRKRPLRSVSEDTRDIVSMGMDVPPRPTRGARRHEIQPQCTRESRKRVYPDNPSLVSVFESGVVICSDHAQRPAQIVPFVHSRRAHTPPPRKENILCWEELKQTLPKSRTKPSRATIQNVLLWE